MKEREGEGGGEAHMGEGLGTLAETHPPYEHLDI